VLNSALEIEFATDCITETLGAVPVKELYKGEKRTCTASGDHPGNTHNDPDLLRIASTPIISFWQNNVSGCYNHFWWFSQSTI
jgi:hypothetical protein